MVDAPTRLRAILASYQLRFPEEKEVELLRRIDAQTVPLLTGTIEFLPTTKETLNGFVDLMDAIDDRLAANGLAQFQGHDALNKAKAHFRKPEVMLENLTVPNSTTGESLIHKYGRLRTELWNTIPSAT